MSSSVKATHFAGGEPILIPDEPPRPLFRLSLDRQDAKPSKKSGSRSKQQSKRTGMEDDWAFLEDDPKTTDIADDFVLLDERTKTTTIPRPIAPQSSQLPFSLSPTSSPYATGYLDEAKFRAMLANEPSIGKSYDPDLWKGIKIAEDPIKARLKLKFLIRKGVPPELRRDVWMAVTGATYFLRAQLQSPEELYQAKLVEVFGPRLPEKILKPPLFGASLSSQGFYLREEAQMSLKRILVILGMDFPSLKFCPMIHDVISLMLHFLHERDAFFCVYSMVAESQTDHRYFTFSPADFNVFNLTFKDVLKKVIPRIYQHMKKKLNMDFKSITENWFQHVFLQDLPFRTVLRVLDAYFNEGGRVLYRIGLGLLAAKEASLLNAKDPETFINILKQSGSQVYNDDHFLKSCFKVSLHPDKVSKLKSKNKIKGREDSHIPHHVYYRPKVSTPSSIVSEDVFEIIYEWIPMRYRITDPQLMFTSTTEGFSMKRFLKKIEDVEPSLLFIKSDSGMAFGAYISSKWRITGKFSFTGSRECFLFQLMPRLKKWGWAEGGVEAFLSVEPSGFSIGGGSSVGLFVNEDWTGSSGTSDTFKNEPLNGDKSDLFECVTVEVWGFQ